METKIKQIIEEYARAFNSAYQGRCDCTYTLENRLSNLGLAYLLETGKQICEDEYYKECIKRIERENELISDLKKEVNYTNKY